MECVVITVILFAVALPELLVLLDLLGLLPLCLAPLVERLFFPSLDLDPPDEPQ